MRIGVEVGKSVEVGVNVGPPGVTVWVAVGLPATAHILRVALPIMVLPPHK